MPLSFAAITPHPPVLLPAIGKGKGFDEVKNTRDAMERLETELYAAHVSTIVIISPHEALHDASFCVNSSTELHATYEMFGDMATKNLWNGCPELAAIISRKAREQNIPVRLVSTDSISHGTSIPLHYLTEHTEKMRVLPIGFSNADPQAHIEFGELLKDAIMESPSQIAIIASGDLADCHSDSGPMPRDEKGAAFDQQLLHALKSGNLDELVKIDNDTLVASNECGYRSMLILMGVIKNMPYVFNEYAYEHPFGVGYLVGQFSLS
jgi:MEMO1 family protein